MHFTRSQSPLLTNYKLNGNRLNKSSQHLYLGTLLDNKVSWSTHIRNTATKAIKTLNFLKCNFSSCSYEVKVSSYLTMVHPKMEYAAAAWDPYYQSDIQHLDKVQRWAARWVFNDFSTFSLVADMLQQLSWPTLQVRHKICRLQTLFKIINNKSPLTIPLYYLEPPGIIIPNVSYTLPTLSTNIYQQSFYSWLECSTLLCSFVCCVNIICTL